VIPVHRLEATSLLEHRFYPYHHIASDNPQSLPLSLPPPIKAVSPCSLHHPPRIRRPRSACRGLSPLSLYLRRGCPSTTTGVVGTKIQRRIAASPLAHFQCPGAEELRRGRPSGRREGHGRYLGPEPVAMLAPCFCPWSLWGTCPFRLKPRTP